MKKILACVLSVIMMLSLATVFASAETWWATSADEFAPVGDIYIQWDPDAASKIKFDGDMSEWADYNMTEIGGNSFASWVGGSDENPDPGMPKDFSMKTYFVADSKGLYIGFYITDDAPFPAPDPAGYTGGDSFQIGLDFGYIIGHQLEEDPDILTNPKDIFYSFGLQAEGNPFVIVRQESDNDGQLTKDNEDEQFAGIDGCTAITSTGWCAEFFLSWNRMFEDAKYKSWLGDGFGVTIGPAKNLEMGCTLYHIGHADANMNWAAGTVKGTTDDNGRPSITWTAYDDGVHLILKYQDGMSFENANIVILEGDETIEFLTEEATEAPATAAPTEAPATEAPTEAASEGASEAGTAAGTTADTTAEEGGCASVIGGSVALLLAAMAAAVALKKH